MRFSLSLLLAFVTGVSLLCGAVLCLTMSAPDHPHWVAASFGYFVFGFIGLPMTILPVTIPFAPSAIEEDYQI